MSEVDGEAEIPYAGTGLQDVISRYLRLTLLGNGAIALCPFCETLGGALKVGEAGWRTLCCGAQEINGSDAVGFIMSFKDCFREEAVQLLGNGSMPEPIPITITPRRRPSFFGLKGLDKPGTIWIHPDGPSRDAGKLKVPSRAHIGFIYSRPLAELQLLKGRQCALLAEQGYPHSMDRLAQALVERGHRVSIIKAGTPWALAPTENEALAIASKGSYPYAAPAVEQTEPEGNPALGQSASSSNSAAAAPFNDAAQREKDEGRAPDGDRPSTPAAAASPPNATPPELPAPSSAPSLSAVSQRSLSAAGAQQPDGVAPDTEAAAASNKRSPAPPAQAREDLTLLRTPKGEIRACDHNAKTLLSAAAQYDDLHFDEFLCRLRIGERDWSDHDDRDTLCWLQAAHEVSSFTLGMTRTAVMALGYARRADSLSEFVMGVPEWDGKERIAQAFIEAWGAPDSPLNRAASRNLFIAMHARAVHPGAQVDNLWVFEGPQGSLKSASLRALGNGFHAEISASVGTADFLRELRGIWIAELSELDSFRGREASTIKRLLSAPSDRFVDKYDRHAAAYPRRAVVVATTNEANYWQDATGARRLIPIRVGTISLKMIRENRLQWFAEARTAYQAGATWWEFPEGIDTDQDERQVVDPWEDILRSAILRGRNSDYGTILWPDGWIASATIMKEWLFLDAAQQGQASSTRLGKVMRRLGFSPHRFGKERERGWMKECDSGHQAA